MPNFVYIRDYILSNKKVVYIYIVAILYSGLISTVSTNEQLPTYIKMCAISDRYLKSYCIGSPTFSSHFG